jgi:sterol desaturase/sphingolipid hydroxylase (fatty acid hydroxylase superfamily)
MDILEFLLTVDTRYIVLGLVVVLFSLEQIIASQFKFSNRPWHLFNNALFHFLFLIINFVWVYVLIFCIEWLNNHQIGLFYIIDAPTWLKLILGVAMFDFVFYWFHRMSHRVPFLWRLHRVHHSDSSMDVSTAFRGHPFEQFLWFGVSRIVAAGIFGLDLLALGFLALIAIPIFFIVHSNIRFPSWLDNTLGWVILTPNQHKVHHEQDQEYTDSNYADIFILWDRLFGTYRYKPVDQIKFGLREFNDSKQESFWYLIKSPFLDITRSKSDPLNEPNKGANKG